MLCKEQFEGEPQQGQDHPPDVWHLFLQLEPMMTAGRAGRAGSTGSVQATR